MFRNQPTRADCRIVTLHRHGVITVITVTWGPVHLLQLCSRAPASHPLGTSLLVLLLYNCGSDEMHMRWAKLRLIHALLFLHLSWRGNAHAKSLHHQPP